jgi:hypothetical protein
MENSGSRWQWYVGAGAILLFCILLIFRLGLPERLLPGTENTVSPLQNNIPAGEVWMNITQGGRKIGYMSRLIARTERGFRSSENLFLRINTMGIVQPLTIQTIADLQIDQTLSGFQFNLGSNLFQFTAQGEVTGKKLIIRVGKPGDEKLSVVELTEAPYLWNGFQGSLGILGLKPGEVRTVTVFDPVSLSQKEVRVTLLGDDSLAVMGKSQQVKKLSVDFMGMKQVAWVEPDGTVLREEGILGIVLEKVARQTALAGLEGMVSEDLTTIAVIPSSRPIAEPGSLKVLKIRFEGLPKNSFLLDGGRQLYRSGLLTIRGESPLDPSIFSGAPVEDLSKFLKATNFIQSDHPKIRQKLNEIIVPGDTHGIKARKIVSWIHRNLEKRPVLSVPSALETLANRVGDCNEHAILLAAFARAAGIPAEVEAGIVYLRGRFYYHAWNVLYLKEWGGWVTADAVFGQMPADVTHVRFVRGATDQQLDLLGLIGKLKIEIVEMTG